MYYVHLRLLSFRSCRCWQLIVVCMNNKHKQTHTIIVFIAMFVYTPTIRHWILLLRLHGNARGNEWSDREPDTEPRSRFNFIRHMKIDKNDVIYVWIEFDCMKTLYFTQPTLSIEVYRVYYTQHTHMLATWWTRWSTQNTGRSAWREPYKFANELWIWIVNN